VAKARPFYMGISEWQAPQPADAKPGEWTGDWRSIICMGTDPNDPAFKRQDLKDAAKKLTDGRFVLIDTKSKPEYGPKNKVRFGPEDIGVETVLSGGPVRIVGTVELGTGLASNGACIVSIAGFARAVYWQPVDQVNFGLIKLKKGADVEKVKAELEQLLGQPKLSGVASSSPADVEVLTRAEVNKREEYRWVVQTPLGKIFNLGVWVAIFVGIAIVYQVLSTDISNMMGEYATLKAMGYSNWYLTRVVLEQAALLAVLGYVPSMLISWALYLLVGARSGLPMVMTWGIAASVFVLAVLMCTVSGALALRKLFQADPADLFK
jgi:putative ABC transport system permease protein